jgi:hypothetical protein
LECYLGAKAVCQLKRVYPNDQTTRARQIDYRHVIHSLAKKPQAFRYSQLRDDLLPTTLYRQIWETVNQTMEAREACKLMVGLLHLAATENCEQALGEVVMQRIIEKQPLRLVDFQNQFRKKNILPVVSVAHATLTSYNSLMMLS